MLIRTLNCVRNVLLTGRRREGGMTLFIFHVSPVCPFGKNLPYHERADKDTARLPHRFQVTGPTPHLPFRPHFLALFLALM